MMADYLSRKLAMFNKLVAERMEVYPSLRYGQAVWDTAYVFNKTIALRLKSMGLDPYHSDHRVPDFLMGFFRMYGHEE